MKRDYLMRTVFLFCSIILIISSCSSIPKKELHEAEIAIQESEKINANKYAPVELQDAKKYLDQAEKQVIEGENEKARNKAIVAKEMGWTAYFRSVNEFARDENESTKSSMDAAKESHADKVVADKFDQALKLYNEMQKDLETLKNLSEKLRKESEL
ncbi:MAG: DUF4398 domain-containing protein [Spirochaetes bacterium]|nr:DUF4398 domain-containing protein [Spirochaetota bacterium]